MPSAAGIGAAYANWHGLTEVTTGHPILDGFIAAFVAFAITLVVAFVIQMFKVVPKRYFEEKDRADTSAIPSFFTRPRTFD